MQLDVPSAKCYNNDFVANIVREFTADTTVQSKCVKNMTKFLVITFVIPLYLEFLKHSKTFASSTAGFGLC
jgi:hypothetical protein